MATPATTVVSATTEAAATTGQRPVPADLAGRRLAQHIARRDSVLARIASVRVVLDKAGAFADDAGTLRALAEDRLAALAVELLGVLGSNPERPLPSTDQAIDGLPANTTSHYVCGACGAAFGITGQGTGSDDDVLADEYFDEQVAWHEAGDCTRRRANGATS